jgi:mRNA interferase YafQ
MSFNVERTNAFKRDIKRCKKRPYDFGLLRVVIGKLGDNGNIPSKYKPHKLKGNYKGRWECHIKPDWLLIWLAR